MAIRANLVNATDLDSLWANRMDARLVLPALIRRLIRATSPSITSISFPSNESIELPGWDGILSLDAASQYAPQGISGWELGTGENIKSKADSDYAKRTLDPLGIDKSTSTFVFVTPRRWHGRHKWLNIKNKEGYWKEVRAYDADNIAEWLELTPGVNAWLAAQLGRHPNGQKDAETFWREWAEATNPKVIPDLVIAGRGAEAQRVYDWLNGPPSAIAVRGDSREEALAFCIATVMRLADAEAEAVIARLLIIDDGIAWTEVTAFHEPLVLAANFDVGSRISVAAGHGHHVLVLLGRNDAATTTTISLPRLSRQGAASALLNMGIANDEAQSNARLARRSLLAFRRSIAILPEVYQPAWSSPYEGISVAPISLAGMWNQTTVGDQQILARLAQVDYHTVNGTVARWISEADPPFRRVGENVYVTSREDSWMMLARFITRADGIRLGTVVSEVLGEVHPKFDLQERERWLADIRGKRPKFSSLLRKGLAETLAVAAANDTTYSPTDAGIDQEHVGAIVRGLLANANENWLLWASLDDVLPTLAEAAPDVFLNAVDEAVSSESPQIVNLFADVDGPLTISAYNTGLLWALERLAWSAAYLGHAALILASLARLDPVPNSRHANRPASSLRDVFLMWHPQTAAEWPQRLDVLDAILDREPVVGWNLLISILPTPYSGSRPTDTPEWRDWAARESPGVSWADVWEACGDVLSRLLKRAELQGDRWAALIDLMRSVPPSLQSPILDGLEELDLSQVNASDLGAICDQLRSILSSSRSFPDSESAIADAGLQRIADLYKKFQPTDPKPRHAWLFSPHPELPDVGRKDWEQWEAALDVQRSEAVSEIFASGGEAAVRDFAQASEGPVFVGIALGRSNLPIGEGTLLANGLASSEAATAAYVRGFVAGRFARSSLGWLRSLAAGEAWGGLAAHQKAELLLCLPASPETWAYVDEAEPLVSEVYWARVGPYVRSDHSYVINRFLDYGRPLAAIRLLAVSPVFRASPDGPMTIIHVLDSVMRTPIDPGATESIVPYEIGDLLNELAKYGNAYEEELARYEMYFLSLLRHARLPTTLHKQIASSPQFFTELLTYVYKARRAEPAEPSPEGAALARAAYDLLQSWRQIPGESESGINARQLRTWFSEAHSLYSAIDRREIGDQSVGQVLSHSRAGSDGAWPEEAVRDLVEQVRSDDLETGIAVGVANNRGVTWRSPGDGGRQELELSEKYRGYAAILSNRWPRTAGMLRGIADTYAAEARREDLHDELDQDISR